MKKIFLLMVVLMIGFYYAHSQIAQISTGNSIGFTDSATMTVKRWRDTCFALLNLSASQIPSGYLLDYSLNPFNDSNFNSLINPNVDTILDIGNLLSMYSILDSSVVNSNATPLGSTDMLLINAYRYQRNTGNIPLIFIYQPFQKIQSTAMSQGLLTITPDSFRLKDVTGRQSSPYYNGLVFAFSPFKSQISQFNGISFSLPSQFWLMPGISSVQVDFGDGAGFRALSQGSIVNIYYGTTGTYYLTAKITTSSGTLIAKSSIQYTQPKDFAQSDSVWNFSVAPLYTSISNYINSNQGITLGSGSSKSGSIQPLGGVAPCSDGSIFNAEYCDINPGAIVYIQNGCDQKFDKPIIVVEGFDPFNSTTQFTLIQMLNNNPSSNIGFYDEMRSQGYDFVFVIFTKNLDFIENNALVLEQVIEKVNASKSGTNKNIVIGYSMGGLIARWALRDMENRSIPHQVGSYFSYDAPHQGANVPLGLQCLFNEMLVDLPALKYNKDILQLYGGFTSYAAQEMLAIYPTYSQNLIGPSALNSVRAIFAQNLITLGYPKTTTNYAITNGRGNNTSGTTSAGNGTQWGGFGPGSGIFQGGILFYVDNLSANAYAISSNSTNALILRYRFSGLKPVSIFGRNVISFWAIRARNITYNGSNPYDDAPGAYERAQSQFVYNFNGKSSIPFWNTGLSVTFYNSGGANTATNFGHFGHNFVPLASALDLQNQGYGASNYFQSNNMYYNIDNTIVSPGTLAGNTLNPSTLSPFTYVMSYTSDCAGESCASLTSDSYLSINNLSPNLLETNNWNLWHEAFISNQTALFSQRKILNTNTYNSCTLNNSLCSITNPLISGPTTVCTTATYTLGGFLGYIQGLQIQWSCPYGRLGITSGQGTPTITVSKLYNGPETVTAVLTNSCGQNATYVLQVSAGPPVVTINYSQNGPCKGLVQTWYLAASPLTGGTNWNWTVGHLNSGSSIYIYTPNSPTTYADVTGGGTVNLAYTDLCGTPQTNGVTLYSSCHSQSVIIAPNPTTGIVTVSTLSSNSNTQEMQTGAVSTSNPAQIYQIKVTDMTGNILKTYSYSSGVSIATVNLSNFVNGTYIIQVFDNSTWTNQKVIMLK